MRKFDVSSLESQLFDREFAARSDSRELLALTNMWRAFLRVRVWIVLATMLGAVAAFAFAQTLESRYTAVAMVMIDTRVQRERALPTAEAVLPTTTTALESELEVLRSHDLVESVVDRLDLDADQEFAADIDEARPGAVASVRKAVLAAREWIGLARVDPEPPVAPDTSDIDRERLIQAIAARRNVELASNLSAVYAISFTSNDPRKAARIANAFAEQYLELQIVEKRLQLDRTYEWLANRANELNRKLVELARQKEAHALRAPFSSLQSLQDAQSLRDSYIARLQTARAQGAATQAQEIERGIEQLNRQLAEQAAHESEAARLQSEVTVAETVYARVVGQLSDLQEQGDILRPDAQIIAQARPPLERSEPRVPFLTAGGAALGFGLLTGFVLLRELGQHRLRTLRDFEEATNLPILGFLPRTRKRAAPLRTVLTGRLPDQRLVQSTRKLKASLAASGSPHQVIAVASSLPGEGKSSFILMLSRAYAEAGEDTLLLDLDIWRSPFRGMVRRSGGPDLAEILAAPELVKDGVRPCRWTGSGGGFDRGAGVAVLELDGAEIAQGGV
jgi:polysaccharide biosynthesis transport protein